MANNRSIACIFLLIIALNGLNLLPVLDSPYLGDDSWCESCIRGFVELTNTSLLDLCLSMEKDYIEGGRWYPLVIYYYPVFYYLTLHAYKALVVLFILLNVCLFGYFVRLVTGSVSAALIASLLPPLFLQIRQYHDPILSYYFLMQVEFSLWLLSLIFFYRFLESSTTRYWTLSIILYVLCVLTYEASYTFWVVHGLVAYLHFGRTSWRAVVKATLPFCLIALVNFVITLLVRVEFGTHYEGVAFRPDPVAWVVTLCKQLIAAAPLSYVLTHGLGDFRDYARAHSIGDLFVVCGWWLVLWSLVSWYAFSEKRTGSAISVRPLVVLGLGFWVLPAIMVPFSAKYQRELRWGIGYLPVYLSGFGLMLLATAALESLHSFTVRLGRPLRLTTTIVATLVGATICGITYGSNRIIIDRYQVAERYPRALIETALRDGLLRDVPPASCLVCSLPFHSWDSPAFFRMHSGIVVQVVRPAGFEPDAQLGIRRVEEAFAGYEVPGLLRAYDFRLRNDRQTAFRRYEAHYRGGGWPVLTPVVEPRCNGEPLPVFLIRYEARSAESGYAVLGRVVTLGADNKSVRAASSNLIRLYVSVSPGHGPVDVRVTGRWIDPATLQATGECSLTDKDLKMVGSGERYRLYELPTTTGPYLDPTSIVATSKSARR